MKKRRWIPQWVLKHWKKLDRKNAKEMRRLSEKKLKTCNYHLIKHCQKYSNLSIRLAKHYLYDGEQTIKCFEILIVVLKRNLSVKDAFLIKRICYQKNEEEIIKKKIKKIFKKFIKELRK